LLRHFSLIISPSKTGSSNQWVIVVAVVVATQWCSLVATTKGLELRSVICQRVDAAATAAATVMVQF
jgi:hypothetical protein